MYAMRETNFAGLESLFLALGDKTRLRLLALMSDGPVAVGLLADQLGDSQPKVSRHLAYLRNAGVVSTRREGKHIYYGIREPEDEADRQILERVVSVMATGGVSFTKPRSAPPPVSAQEVEPDLDIYAGAYENTQDEPQYEEGYDDTPMERAEMDVFLL
jgi:DNA-binding transcriptional ArsR family regulator